MLMSPKRAFLFSLSPPKVGENSTRTHHPMLLRQMPYLLKHTRIYPTPLLSVYPLSCFLPARAGSCSIHQLLGLENYNPQPGTPQTKALVAKLLQNPAQYPMFRVPLILPAPTPVLSAPGVEPGGWNNSRETRQLTRVTKCLVLARIVRYLQLLPGKKKQKIPDMCRVWYFLFPLDGSPAGTIFPCHIWREWGGEERGAI